MYWDMVVGLLLLRIVLVVRGIRIPIPIKQRYQCWYIQIWGYKPVHILALILKVEPSAINIDNLSS